MSLKFLPCTTFNKSSILNYQPSSCVRWTTINNDYPMSSPRGWQLAKNLKKHPQTHKMLLFFLLLFSCGNVLAQDTAREWKVYDLKCDNETSPLGLDNPQPSFSWALESSVRGILQTSYRILVASSPEQLASNQGDMWDSGECESAQATGIPYQGNPLQTFGKYYWKVFTKIQGEGFWSAPASFEMGFMNDKDWPGGWICYATGMPGRVLYYKATLAPGQNVREARAYVSGLGYYELEINHKKVGENVLDPAQSSYGKRCYYTTYDITDCLLPEPNTIVIAVAPGWYGTPKLRFFLRAVLEDGNAILYTSDNMRCVTAGSTVYSTVFDGEQYDPREENPELYTPFQPPLLMNKHWAFAYNIDEPYGRMASQRVEPIRVVDTFAPARIERLPNGDYIVDAGRNMAGWARIRVQGEAGQKVRMRFAETLREDGTVNQDNLRNAKAEDTYTLAGEGVEVWEPRFTYHGFRYIQISGLPSEPKEGDIEMRVVRSSVAVTGQFSCSDRLLNDIHRMIFHTESNNLHSVPTDCPQRDERMGWLNDLTVRIDQAIYNFDMSRFYPKFMQDVADTQGEDGTITCVAPFRFGARPADPVSVSFLLMAYRCYEFYGNRTLVEKMFDAIKAWTTYLYTQHTHKGLVDYSYYGDWCPPREFLLNPNSGVSRDTPGLLISTGYLHYYASLMIDMAKVAGRDSDIPFFEQIRKETFEAFNREYWDEEKGGYGSNNQAANSFAIYMGLATGERYERALRNLVADVEARDYHLTTGNLCTKYLMEVLSEHGYPEVAYRLATQTTYPSWGFMLSKGATSLWERWEYLTGDEMNSHDHPMMGSIGSWFYKYVLGIRTDFHHPAFERFLIHPCLFSALQHAEGELKTVKGPIRTSWKKQGRTYQLHVEIPANTRAEIHIPTNRPSSVKESGRKVTSSKDFQILSSGKDKLILEAGSGSYTFSSSL